MHSGRFAIKRQQIAFESILQLCLQAAVEERRARYRRLCGDGPRIWLAMQLDYDLWHAERHLAGEVARIPTLRAA